MKILQAFLLLAPLTLLTFSGPASARAADPGSLNRLVPVDHWAYAMFDYMNRHEDLGYAPGYFSGEQALPFHTFAEATIRLYALEQQKETDDASELMARALWSEFISGIEAEARGEKPPDYPRGMGGMGSAYDDIPTDHWSYAAFDYLCREGILEGYPEGFFSGLRVLTRYEFAQATARLLDTIYPDDNRSEEIKLLAAALRDEFSDQLSQSG